MKKLLAITTLFVGLTAMVNAEPATPIWEETDQHFIYYRGLCAEGSISSLDNLIDNIDYYADQPYRVRELCEQAKQHIVNARNAISGVDIN